MYKPSPEGKSYTQKRLCHWHSLFCMDEDERGWRFTEEFSAFACIPQHADGPAGKKKSCIRAAAVRTQDHKKIGVARLELAASCSQSRRATNCATPRHPAAQLHRRNIVYRFLCGSSIRNPQLTALHGLLFSADRSGSWQQRKRARQQALFEELGAVLVQLPKRERKK